MNILFRRGQIDQPRNTAPADVRGPPEFEKTINARQRTPPRAAPTRRFVREREPMYSDRNDAATEPRRIACRKAPWHRATPFPKQMGIATHNRECALAGQPFREDKRCEGHEQNDEGV